MKPEAQRIAIAEACGFAWYRIPHSEKHSRGPLRSLFLPAVHEVEQDPIWMVRADGSERIANWQYMRDEGHVPNYTEDLNEIHRAILEKFTDNDSAALYLTALEDVVQTWMLNRGVRFAHLEYWVANATADQCSEAFLKAIGKWRDDDK